MSSTQSTKASRPRRYSSARRRQQAEQTRADVLRAAVTVFGRAGWAGTTLVAVAREAGVAVETIYSQFGSKKNLLRHAFDVSIVGDVEPVPLSERPEYLRLARGSRAQRIAAGMRLQSAAMQRTAQLWPAVWEAAGSDPEVAAWWAELERVRRRQNQHSLELILGKRLGGSQLDVVWALLGVDVYRKLVTERGWSTARYEKWLARAVLAVSEL